MTIDDDNSIYVGGLPYDCTEESIRRVFDLYGAVVAVKIINDREAGGKCYAFVTFTNPRSAIGAINDMDGRTIGGRVVRVNEVRTRGARPNFNRESFRHNSERVLDLDKGRDQCRFYDNDRDHYYDRNHYHDRDNDRSRVRGWEREREYEHGRDHGRAKDCLLDQDRGRSKEENEQEHDRTRDHDWERNHSLDWEKDTDMGNNDRDKSRDKDKDQQSKNQTGSHITDQHRKELLSNSSDYYNQIKEQLDISIQRREELQKEISQLEENLEGKKQFVLDLQKKSWKLEEALATAKKLSSYQQMQLTKLHRCFLQVKDYSERLKSSEQELQSRLMQMMSVA
ncbi:PREDICTED: zinc finger CCCH domain-containing protein 25-like isoform X2 [Nelumbo nucifera]|uniref:Zinc finger CCCH domain-containing protein 25-like isoform X2 n=1 Tax=Nelumbo nucifera TaxID=4432 RepID=A0A1U7ZBA1_NELNU|nr:PREDICTED: zinc finger CCCH domain-containing protein 25-like isoform X2 [Nelumbo nucifera]